MPAASHLGILSFRAFPARSLRAPQFHDCKYAFRRGAASIPTQLTGNPIAASQLLRHKNISVTMTPYIKADRTALTNGMKLLEESLSKE